jgi:aspartyl protease family protein
VSPAPPHPAPAAARAALAALVTVLVTATAVAAETVRVIALFKDRAMLVVDGHQRLLRAGQTSPEGVTLISASAEQAVLEIGGERRPYQLGAQISSSFEGPRTRSVHLYPSGNGMYLTTGSINGLPVELLVDTGATLVSMSGRDARRLGIDYLVIGEPARSTTASGISSVYLVDLERVQVGDITLRNVRGAVHDGDFPPRVLLGQSFLNRLDMRRDGTTLMLTQEQ